MKTIYETTGRAREYYELGLNIYTGCDHICGYCYNFLRWKQDVAAFARSKPRRGIIAALERQVGKWTGEERHILLSFASDAYQHLDGDLQLTRQAIWLLKERGLNVCILTKAGQRATRDFDLLDPKTDHIGTTLTVISEADQRKWEPRAASTMERIGMLQDAKAAGFYTWVSFEPVIRPSNTLHLIRYLWPYVDNIKVGKMNYIDLGVDWRKFAVEVKELLDSLSVDYYMKRDLRRYLPREK